MSQSAGAALRSRFLQGMSRAAWTVNIVTTDGPTGRAGVTVSSMTSVSAEAERPILLVCVNRQSPTAAMILENGVFCVNMLREGQSYLSEVFAGRHAGALKSRFDAGEWVDMPSGAPRLSDPLIAFDCAVLDSHLVGTHHVIFGAVTEVFDPRSGTPLIYANRSYGDSRG